MTDPDGQAVPEILIIEVSGCGTIAGDRE